MGAGREAVRTRSRVGAWPEGGCTGATEEQLEGGCVATSGGQQEFVVCIYPARLLVGYGERFEIYRELVYMHGLGLAPGARKWILLCIVIEQVVADMSQDGGSWGPGRFEKPCVNDCIVRSGT